MATYKRIQIISFLVVLFAVFIVVLLVLKPFVNIMALGLIIAILFRPLYNKMMKFAKNSTMASLLTLLIILLVIIGPLYLFGQIIFNELIQLYNHYRSGSLVINRSEIIGSVPQQLQGIIENFSRDINNYIGRLSSQAFATLSGLLSNVASFFVSFFMLLFVVFYLLKDGHEIKKVFMDISPIASAQENKLFDRIVAAVNGVVKGAFIVALAQGVVATIGFLIFGVPQPFLWGMFTVLAALVPTIGTSLSLIPAVLYLAITGHTPQAIGLAVWGVLAVGLIDNFLSPKLIGNSVKLHPVLVLLAVIGGLQFFGFLGFLIGPILMAIFVALIDMYRTDFKDVIRE